MRAVIKREQGQPEPPATFMSVPPAVDAVLAAHQLIGADPDGCVDVLWPVEQQVRVGMTVPYDPTVERLAWTIARHFDAPTVVEVGDDLLRIRSAYLLDAVQPHGQHHTLRAFPHVRLPRLLARLGKVDLVVLEGRHRGQTLHALRAAWDALAVAGMIIVDDAEGSDAPLVFGREIAQRPRLVRKAPGNGAACVFSRS